MKDVPFDEQMELNKDKKRIDKKVRKLEMEAEERLKSHYDDKALKERIRKRAIEMEKSLFPK